MYQMFQALALHHRTPDRQFVFILVFKLQCEGLADRPSSALTFLQTNEISRGYNGWVKDKTSEILG